MRASMRTKSRSWTGLKTSNPGTEAELSVPVEEGKYVLICNIFTAGESHYLNGMYNLFTVDPSAPAPSPLGNAMSIREAIDALVDERRDLTEDEAGAAMREILGGEATPAQLAAFLVALRLKGETVDEIAGMARVMREHALHVEVDGPLLDTCGTGGDGSGTFNVSTAAAFVAAGAGARVAKHGNRAMTSGCGSADVLEALGAKIDLSPEQVAECIERTGFGFMFAQAFHPAMKHAAPTRARDRRPHRLQHPRPADQPGGRPAPAAGRRPPGARAQDGRGPRPSRQPSRARRARRRRRRRAVAQRTDARPRDARRGLP